MLQEAPDESKRTFRRHCIYIIHIIYILIFYSYREDEPIDGHAIVLDQFKTSLIWENGIEFDAVTRNEGDFVEPNPLKSIHLSMLTLIKIIKLIKLIN